MQDTANQNNNQRLSTTLKKGENKLCSSCFSKQAWTRTLSYLWKGSANAIFWVLESRDLLLRLVSFIRRDNREFAGLLFPGMRIKKWVHCTKLSAYKPGRELSPGPELAKHFDLGLSRLQEINKLLMLSDLPDGILLW